MRVLRVCICALLVCAVNLSYLCSHPSAILAGMLRFQRVWGCLSLSLSLSHTHAHTCTHTDTHILTLLTGASTPTYTNVSSHCSQVPHLPHPQHPLPAPPSSTLALHPKASIYLSTHCDANTHTITFHLQVLPHPQHPPPAPPSSTLALHPKASTYACTLLWVTHPQYQNAHQ